MTTPTSGDNRPKNIWFQFLAPVVAGGAGVIGLPYYFLTVKTALQSMERPPAPSFEMLKRSVQVTPVLSTQIALNNVNLAIFKKVMGEEHPYHVVASTLVSGALSAPLLAAFNGLTMNPPRSIWTSCLEMTRRQFFAIQVRESSFLLALNVNKLVTSQAKETFGYSQVVEYGTAFTVGAVGSILGHIPDTFLTCSQKRIKIQGPRHALAGAVHRMVAIGFFNMQYTFITKQI